MSQPINIPAMQIPAARSARLHEMMKEMGTSDPVELLDRALRLLDTASQAMTPNGDVELAGNEKRFHVKLK